MTFTRPALKEHTFARGEDVEQGGEVLAAGTRLSPAGIGLLASIEPPTFRSTVRPELRFIGGNIAIESPLTPKIRIQTSIHCVPV